MTAKAEVKADDNAGRARGLTVIGASAGTGKTTRLTRAVLDALTAGLGPDKLCAVTYTSRAQVELESRIRQKLLEAGRAADAATLPLAYVGTVHAVCLRWMQELALEAGLSPRARVLLDPETLLAEVLEGTLEAADYDAMEELAARLSINRDDRQRRNDWHQAVVDVVDLARGGRIAPSALAAMAERSVEGFERLLPPPHPSASQLDRALEAAIDEALEKIPRSTPMTGASESALKRLADNRREISSGRTLPWKEWAALAKLKVGAKSRPAVESLHQAASRVLEHPRLRADLRSFVERVYGLSASALTDYARLKRERGLIDYVDMIEGALDLLAKPRVREELGARLDLVVVDELQDSSPVQLALFLELYAITGSSRWVGDPKQCIFEYAGADPALMDAVLDFARAEGAEVEQLSKSWRSRPALIELTNAVFSAAFAAHGLCPEDVVIDPERREPDELRALPPLGVFALESSNQAGDAVAIAEGVAALLDHRADTPVEDRATGVVRPLEPGDIAVLTTTNHHAKAIAVALYARGVRAALARPGLLSTPEGLLVEAAIELLVDERDAGAAAVIEALTGFGGRAPEAWLSDRVVQAARERAQRLEGTEPTAPRPSLLPAALAPVRRRTAVLSPAETVDAVIGALDLANLAARWPDPEQRLANLDALRAFARAYEAGAEQLGRAATLAGLLANFEDAQSERIIRGEMMAIDAQSEARGRDAVTLITYHRSKGLEWPVVVLASLADDRHRDVFDVQPERDGEALDPAAPLAGRWIRYWPWPFAKVQHPLWDTAQSSPEGQRVQRRDARERVRLLYVGMTRARDHLIFAARRGKDGSLSTSFLDVLVDTTREGEARRLLRLPGDASGNAAVEVRGPGGATLRIPARVQLVGPEGERRVPTERSLAYPRRLRPAPAERSYGIAPSSAESSGLELGALRVQRIEPFAPPLELGLPASTDFAAVGDALHRLLAAELAPDRHALATRLLCPLGVSDPEVTRRAVASAEALDRFFEDRWPGAPFVHEVPITAAIDHEGAERAIGGSIDRLIETTEGLVVVDFKSDRVLEDAALGARAKVHAPQLAAYARALEVARPEAPVIGLCLAFLSAGKVVWMG